MSIGYEIVRLKLQNFIHFSDILGLPDLEIDRRGSKNDILLITGGNGTGKSLLMSHFSPFPIDRTNNRKKALTLPDIEACKELDIITRDEDGNLGNYLYKCKIIYGKNSTNCSLIKEDLVTGESEELNKSGLVSSYEEILMKIFNIKKNYINIGYISAQVTSLVSMTPNDRYNYLSSWLPDISNYLDAYKLVFKRINSLNRQIRTIENDIGDMSVESITQQTNILKTKRKSIEKEIEDIRTIRMKLTITRDNLANVDRDFISRTIEKININKSILDDSYKRIKKMSEKSKSYRGKNGEKKLREDILQCENRIKYIKDRLEWLSNSINEKRIRLKETEYSLGMLKDTGDSLPEVSSMIERVENSMMESQKIMDNYLSKYKYLEELPSNITLSELNIVFNLISSIHDKIDYLTDIISIEKLDNLSNYSELNDTKTSILCRKIRDLDDKISNTLERISLLKNSPLDPSILDLKPSICSIDCGIIEEIKRLLSPDVEIEKLQNELETIYKDKEKLSKEIDHMENENANIRLAINYIGDINHSINRDKNYIVYLPYKLREILSGDISKIVSNMNMLLRDTEVIREFVSIRDQYNTYLKENKSLKEKESSLKFIRNINSDIKNMNESIESLLNERKELSNEGNKLIEEIQNLNELQESLNSINSSIDEYNDLSIDLNNKIEKMKKICKDWYYREKLTRCISKLNFDIDKKEIELENCNEEYDKLNNSIITKKSLIDLRDRLISNMKELTVLQNAWNPKTGIPSLFINNFLSRIHQRANLYLEALNGKTLKIEKFEIGKTAREFPIVIDKSGTIIPDASQLSEGQLALITLAISLAMLNEAVSDNGYNVLRLDELDACLDFKRRKTYINLIQESLREVNSKQCIIISHSNEFDNIECDVILLPGASNSVDSLNNKNILLDLSDIDIDTLNQESENG